MAYINALNDQKNAIDEWGTDKFSEDWPVFNLINAVDAGSGQTAAAVDLSSF